MNLVLIFITIFVVLFLVSLAVLFWVLSIRRSLQESKNYERGLKMVPILIHLPPPSDDIEGGSRDHRDISDEVIFQAQMMYGIISSTATKGFKAKVYGQRHLSFEIISKDGLVYYYAVVPTVLVDTVRHAVAAAYPTARLEEQDEHNIFNRAGSMSGVCGGEFELNKEFHFPIATYTEAKHDASRALLNAISVAKKNDGVGVQFLIRPARQGWSEEAISRADKIVNDKLGEKKKSWLNMFSPLEIMEALWSAPDANKNDGGGDKKPSQRELNTTEKAQVEAIHEKVKYPGYEVMIRVVVASNSAQKSQAILANVVSAFSSYNSSSLNGLTFKQASDLNDLITAYIFRFFPQKSNKMILNSVELATLYHLPERDSIPNSQVKRQKMKQVDGPTEEMEDGLLIGYNEFRGVKKAIRLSDKDRRRHMHIIGQTGVGKSVLQENLAYQDMVSGRGFAFVDPHGDSVEKLLSLVPPDRVEDVIYFNPGDMDNPIGLNVFEYGHPDEKDFLINEMIEMFYSLFDPNRQGMVGARFEHIFRNCALLLMADPKGGTLIDVPKAMIDPEFVKQKLKYVDDQNVLDFWTKEWPAAQKSNEAGEVTSWVVSKFGPFMSNKMIANVIGQTKSGLNIEHVLNSKKILLVNLSKGKLGAVNSKLLGVIFVMKFQAAAMARAKIPEDERQDFTLYVDEFQNFATDSFETILSEARKYRLSLTIGNQFMTQLKEELREAILGNVGTTITGRIGSTDAEIMLKRYPTFEIEDLIYLPNYNSICVAQINGTPSAPFTLAWPSPMGNENKQLHDALVKLSAAKYGRPRVEVEQEIKKRTEVVKKPSPTESNPKSSGKSSFLDEWLEKRKKLNQQKSGAMGGLNSRPPFTSSQKPLVNPFDSVQEKPQNFQSSAQSKDGAQAGDRAVSQDANFSQSLPPLRSNFQPLQNNTPSIQNNLQKSKEQLISDNKPQNNFDNSTGVTTMMSAQPNLNNLSQNQVNIDDFGESTQQVQYQKNKNVPQKLSNHEVSLKDLSAKNEHENVIFKIR